MRVARSIALLLTVAAAVGVLFVSGARFGELPECGTGSYFLYPLEAIASVFGAAVVMSMVSAIAVGITVPRGRQWLAMTAVVAVSAVAAAVGCAWSEAEHGCGRFRDHGYVEMAAFVAFLVGFVVAAITLVVVRAVRRPPDVESPPSTGPGGRLVGAFHVHRSLVMGFAPGGLAWVVVRPEGVDLVGPDGYARRIEREGLSADVLGRRTGLWVDGQQVVELEPADGGDPSGIVIAFERAASDGAVSAD